ncbi:MAG: DUF4112 domain-containing protein [Cyclobacteriaceae bacterium]|nr:DUF4112 domain-containing protein [Cyclobacteriaceae bacterium]
MDQSNQVTELKWITKVSHWMDEAFRIPGTNIRFGLDPILGLIPFIGDLISYGISGTMVLSMVRHGVSGKALLMMLGNITLDYLISSIPILGDIFDFGFKANQRNLRILHKHQLEGKYRGSGWGYIVAIVILFILLMVALTVVIWKALLYWYQWLGSAT